MIDKSSKIREKFNETCKTQLKENIKQLKQTILSISYPSQFLKTIIDETNKLIIQSKQEINNKSKEYNINEEKLIQYYEIEIQNSKNKINLLNSQYSEYQRNNQNNNNVKNRKINNIENEISQLESEKCDFNRNIKKIESEISQSNNAYNNSLYDMRRKLDECDSSIDYYNNSINEAQRILNSLEYEIDPCPCYELHERRSDLFSGVGCRADYNGKYDPSRTYEWVSKNVKVRASHCSSERFYKEYYASANCNVDVKLYTWKRYSRNYSGQCSSKQSEIRRFKQIFNNCNSQKNQICGQIENIKEEHRTIIYRLNTQVESYRSKIAINDGNIQMKKRILEQEREDIQRSQTQLSNQLDDINKQINSIKKKIKRNLKMRKSKLFFRTISIHGYSNINFISDIGKKNNTFNVVFLGL